MGYMMFCHYALLEAWTAPWTWPVRPRADPGAWICACAVFTADVIFCWVFRGRTPRSERLLVGNTMRAAEP